MYLKKGLAISIWILSLSLVKSGQVEAVRNITVVGDEFVVDGKPLRVMSGSVHYFRMPAENWRDRLQKLKAAGLNAVSTYVEWSFHEPEYRQYSFEGDRDVVKFIRMAAEEGLYVLLRPGPYICAERDMGGLPYWLLSKYPNIILRSTDKDFMNETKLWMEKVFKYMTPLLYSNGGPIILVQVENEYGSYGRDNVYKEELRDIFLKYVGSKALLYSTDGWYKGNVFYGRIKGTITTIDFGRDKQDIVKVFKDVQQFMYSDIRMNSEYYAGWLTHWGDSHMADVPKEMVATSIHKMLAAKVNFNLFMFYGGSNFEFGAGAIWEDTYKPFLTTYDYNAPISESGDLTPKYYVIRDILKEYNPELDKIPIPQQSPKLAYGKLTVKPCISVISAKGRASLGKKYNDVTGSTLPFFEELHQRAGLMLYETTISDANGVLDIENPRDRVYVYVNGELNGVIDRQTKKFKLSLNAKAGSTLSLLVESQGRMGMGSNDHLKDFKGLKTVTYNEKLLSGKWSITGYPLQIVNGSCTSSNEVNLKKGPILFEGLFTLNAGQKALDTFFYPTGWGKGYVWINGHNLGRYWPNKGPQVTVYVPGVWLHDPPAQNHLRILELEHAPDNHTVELIDHPILI